MKLKIWQGRIRKSTKYSYIIIAIIIIITSFCNLIRVASLKENFEKTKQVYAYTNKFNYDYKVNLLPNDFVDASDISGNNVAYVTDLIDNIDLNLNFSYVADKESSLAYDYEIIGKTQAFYTKDGVKQKVLEKEEVLQNKVFKSEKNSKLQVNEKLQVNLNDKNRLINDFKQKMGMAIDAKYIVVLKINIKTDVEEQKIDVTEEPVVEISLAEKTTEILGENNKESKKGVLKKYKEPIKNHFKMAIDIICAALGILLLVFASKSEVAYKTRNQYKKELNRILKIAQDKIVQVSTKPESDIENTVVVKDFDEILKLSDELFKPILYYYDKEKDEALFCVMSNNMAYKYILKK